MSLLERIHGGFVHNRRIRVLAGHLIDLIPAHARVLDIGAGDGLLANLIQQRRGDIEMRGIDVLIRENTHVPVAEFDGKHIPYDDVSFDFAMFVDVLHHADDPEALLREAVRVSRHGLVIKDHTRTGFLADPTLRFMDWVGNHRHGVALPYNYWTEQEWLSGFERLGLKIVARTNDLGLYPKPANLLFDRSLHFVARVERI